MRQKILVVDDEEVIRDIVRESLEPLHAVGGAEGPEAALHALREEHHDILVTDIRMPGGGGVELVRTALAEFPELAVIVITGRGSLEEFVAFLRMGVVDYLLKPFRPDALRQTVARAVEIRRLRRENRRLAGEARPATRIDVLVGESQAMRAVKEAIAQVAPTTTTALITGRCGTGKELAARAIHRLSGRASGPFLAVNCGALPEGLLESELFGHARGAFTGAERARAGLFAEATGGTVFLDEVGTMSLGLQVRLLRILGSREYTRLGEERVRTADVRIVAATNEDLGGLVAAGRFREDLYFRLKVFPIRMPDLAERDGDIALLAPHLLAAICLRLGRPPKALLPGSLAHLRAHAWPGNVRELENALERAVILSGDHDAIAPELLRLGHDAPAGTGHRPLPDGGLDLQALLEGLERQYVESALRRVGRNKQQAANLLGLQRTTLVQKLRRWSEA